jgi:hypothetical protein
MNAALKDGVCAAKRGKKFQDGFAIAYSVDK